MNTMLQDGCAKAMYTAKDAWEDGDGNFERWGNVRRRPRPLHPLVPARALTLLSVRRREARPDTRCFRPA